MSLFGDDEGGSSLGDGEQLEKVVEVSWEVPDGPIAVQLDRQMMHRVLTNLVRNAAQAVRDMKRGDKGRVRVALVPHDSDWVHLEVDADGPGIKEELRETVFDPYVTTKHDGTGLGLSIVKKIVMEHGGTIDAGASPWGGARMTIRLPRSGTAASNAALEQVVGPSSSRRSVLRLGSR